MSSVFNNFYSVPKKLIASILPTPFKKWLRDKYANYQFKYQLKRASLNHKNALKKVREREKITVAFFLIHESVWKYEELYKLMEKDDRFKPIVFICPYLSYGDEVMHREMRQAYDSLKKNGYNVVKTLNESNGDWLNIKKVYNPDIVFFTNPWNLTRAEYLIQNYADTLTCYVPYGFKNSWLYEAHFNKPMQNLVWRFFLETEIHKKLSLKYSRNKSINTVVTGYPGMDKFLEKGYKPHDVWKIKDKKIKRVIWAPHHTIPGHGATLNYSTFLVFCDYMFEIAREYQDRIQFAFKPHPILRPKLSRDNVWGKEKTDKYFKKWAELPNGQVHEGEYIDLFLTSDAMIHDSSSFIIEYLYTNKPVMFLMNDDSVIKRFNEIGQMALSKIYQGKKEEDIETFIEKVLLQNHDTMLNERVQFFNSIIKPPGNNTASENIFNHLASEIFSDEN